MSDCQLTVIIPTYNRRDVLFVCLRALETQSVRGFDVIVVDDGSNDGTIDALASYRMSTQMRLRVLSQQNAGPAKARNLALRVVSTPVSLLIGDDILASPTLVEKHLEFHSKVPSVDCLALGFTRWDVEQQEVTSFMEWYEKIQFDYPNLLAGRSPTWQHAYTSNLSFKTSLLLDNPFDERFTAAGWEDSELAYRLWKTHHFDLTFLRDAEATHVHPTTFRQACRRMQTLGRMQRLFHQLHPELVQPPPTDIASQICSFLGRHEVLRKWITVGVDRMVSPGRLHGMVLRAHEQGAYHFQT